MTFGVVMFIAMLTMTVQITYNLYTTSVVTGLALDAARDVAERHGAAPAEAESELSSRLAGDVEFDIHVEGNMVIADIRWETRSLFPALSDARAFGVLDRTFAVRIEEQQP